MSHTFIQELIQNRNWVKGQAPPSTYSEVPHGTFKDILYANLLYDPLKFSKVNDYCITLNSQQSENKELDINKPLTSCQIKSMSEHWLKVPPEDLKDIYLERKIQIPYLDLFTTYDLGTCIYNKLKDSKDWGVSHIYNDNYIENDQMTQMSNDTFKKYGMKNSVNLTRYKLTSSVYSKQTERNIEWYTPTNHWINASQQHQNISLIHIIGTTYKSDINALFDLIISAVDDNIFNVDIELALEHDKSLTDIDNKLYPIYVDQMVITADKYMKQNQHDKYFIVNEEIADKIIKLYPNKYKNLKSICSVSANVWVEQNNSDEQSYEINTSHNDSICADFTVEINNIPINIHNFLYNTNEFTCTNTLLINNQIVNLKRFKYELWKNHYEYNDDTDDDTDDDSNDLIISQVNIKCVLIEFLNI